MQLRAMNRRAMPSYSLPRRSTPFVLLAVAAGTLYAQENLAPAASAPAQAPRRGLQLQSVSAYFDYYSSTLPSGGGFQSSSKLLSDVAGGGSVQVGWFKTSERSNSSIS